jgi:hypothetical protein
MAISAAELSSEVAPRQTFGGKSLRGESKKTMPVLKGKQRLTLPQIRGRSRHASFKKRVAPGRAAGCKTAKWISLSDPGLVFRCPFVPTQLWRFLWSFYNAAKKRFHPAWPILAKPVLQLPIAVSVSGEILSTSVISSTFKPPKNLVTRRGSAFVDLFERSERFGRVPGSPRSGRSKPPHHLGQGYPKLSAAPLTSVL